MNESHVAKSGEAIVGLLLHNVVDEMLEGFQIIDHDWRYLYVNATVCKQGKRKKEDLLGRTMMECYPGIDQAPLFAQLQKSMTEHIAIWMENEFTFPDQTKGWFRLYINPIAEGILILSVDITERRLFEVELDKKTDALEAFLQENENPQMDILKEKISALRALTKTPPSKEVHKIPE